MEALRDSKLTHSQRGKYLLALHVAMSSMFRISTRRRPPGTQKLKPQMQRVVLYRLHGPQQQMSCHLLRRLAQSVPRLSPPGYSETRSKMGAEYAHWESKLRRPVMARAIRRVNEHGMFSARITGLYTFLQSTKLRVDGWSVLS